MFKRFESAVVVVLTLALLPFVPAAPKMRAVEVSTYVWEGQGEHFGGFSAIETSPDGREFITISDKAAFYSGTFERGTLGQVTEVHAGAPILPQSWHGTPLTPHMSDAEGAALSPDGRLFVSYETWDRVVEYARGGRDWIVEFWPDLFKAFIPNAGLEALAVDNSGTLYALPERPPLGGATPVYRGRGQNWAEAFQLRRDRNWSPVGADFGPDGRLYVLERDFWPLIGFSSRVRAIAVDNDVVTADEVIWQSDPGRHDNLEGLAAWRAADGSVRLTMISDDNFLPVQQTEIVDLRLTD